MRCPKCGCEESKVVDSRPSESNDAIRRRRECTRCGFRFTTYERCEETPLLVVKKDGHKETFDRQKLMRGLVAATVKRPTYAYEGDAGRDLRANEDVVLAPFERRLIGTGLAIAIPDGYAGFVQPRSGLALKKGLSMANTPGLVDAHYRGELRVCAINLDAHEPIVISKGERIAQLVIQRVPQVHLREVEQLDETDRGEGGFGSSGVN